MAEQTFRSPGFFEKEIDLSGRVQEVAGTPAGIIGTSEFGPAFIPVTIGSFIDFKEKFGDLDSTKFGPYAVNEFLKNRTAVTFMRVLGAGANTSTTDIQKTIAHGTVTNAGFRVIGSVSTQPQGPNVGHQGSVQFLTAKHTIQTNETQGYPVFTDNDSFAIETGGDVHLVRGMIFTSTGSRVQVLSYWENYPVTASAKDVAGMGYDVNNSLVYKKFKVVISSSAGSSFANDENKAGIRILTASLNPTNDDYISKILNTDPERFQEEQHLLYADFSVEDEVATATNWVGIVSGSASTSDGSGDTSLTYRDMYGRFDTRYSSSRTTYFTSQKYGENSYNLFYFETLDDGANTADKYKVSIADLRKSTDPKSEYGSFTVQIRRFGDSDVSPQIVEQYPLCTLDPTDENFVARKVGDLSVKYNFDALSEDERRYIVKGDYPNVSRAVRIVLSDDIKNGNVPASAMPFGFRGLPVLKTNNWLADSLTDAALRRPIKDVLNGGSSGVRLAFCSGSGPGVKHNEPTALTGSIVPPVPLRFKVTQGTTAKSGYPGKPGTNERVSTKFYWGIRTSRIPRTGSMGDAILNANASGEINELVRSYTRFLGIKKLDALVTGSGADIFCNNEFSLNKVALSTTLNKAGSVRNVYDTIHADLTGTAGEHMLESAYIRNGRPEPGLSYAINQRGATVDNRLTLGTLLNLTSSTYFNRFTQYAKFTNIMYGGYDGTNILDPDMGRMNDRASSSDTRGKASRQYPAANTDLDIGLAATSYVGAGKHNNTVASYRSAIDIMTDPMVTRINILAVPGIRDSFVTDRAADRTREYSQAIYLMDIPSYTDGDVRIFDSDDLRPNVGKTRAKMDSRAIDNNYSATYFPDISMVDDRNGNPVKVPASIAALSALGFNDSVAYPWFAPAGFNRAALSNVVNVATRLNSEDRDNLYDSRINPIASFPQAGFVIFGQKTLQQARSALDRVNVRRMLLEVKRLVSDVAKKLVFEQNTPGTRAKFISQVAPLLATIQSQQGIDQFRVIMDDSNNTTEDIESNRLNGRIVLVPTRAVEFIAIDFIITNSGVSFE